MLPRGHSVLARRAPRRRRSRSPPTADSTTTSSTRCWRRSPAPRNCADDDRFDSVTGRRSSIEWALATTLADEPNITVRRGSAVMGLVAGDDVDPRGPSRVRRPSRRRRDHQRRSRRRRNRPALTNHRLDHRARRPGADRGRRGQRLHVHRSLLPQADGSTPELRAPILSPLGSISVLCIAVRQRHVGDDVVRGVVGCPDAATACPRCVRARDRASVPTPRPLARRRADQRDQFDERCRRPHPPIRRR